MPLAERPATAADAGACTRIVRELPEFFTPDVPATVHEELGRHDAWVITEDGTVLGFAIVRLRGMRAAEIRWLAITAHRRGHGLGTRLLRHVLARLRHTGVALVEAKTLDASAEYPPYVATRAFWERRGFVLLDTIDPFPDWAPGNPCALYVAALATTTDG